MWFSLEEFTHLATLAATSKLTTFHSNTIPGLVSTPGSPKGHTCHPGPRGPPACLHPCISCASPPSPIPPTPMPRCRPPGLCTGPTGLARPRNGPLNSLLPEGLSMCSAGSPAPSPIPTGQTICRGVSPTSPAAGEPVLTASSSVQPTSPRKEGSFKLLSRTPLTWIRGEGLAGTFAPASHSSGLRTPAGL